MVSSLGEHQYKSRRIRAFFASALTYSATVALSHGSDNAIKNHWESKGVAVTSHSVNHLACCTLTRTYTLVPGINHIYLQQYISMHSVSKH